LPLLWLSSKAVHQIVLTATIASSMILRMLTSAERGWRQTE
jgi:hypothetical protein